jgi:hypothetical protein
VEDDEKECDGMKDAFGEDDIGLSRLNFGVASSRSKYKGEVALIMRSENPIFRWL